ncbi:hypothetical protein [Parasphingorhabdus halotolerans]|uniref:Uncharacterized protein n=1 Tax=Parasphingorhabdus halotolerans TaxID=2725558 RepID=A0A6H2DMU2_9SPHN|nr:hypothetical protein [Parasphingorhabdus halotolerans]QJB69275.1 hypothetical protein HF685_08275 [Parasphingorhabdus halotolerans]
MSDALDCRATLAMTMQYTVVELYLHFKLAKIATRIAPFTVRDLGGQRRL